MSDKSILSDDRPRGRETPCYAKFLKKNTKIIELCYDCQAFLSMVKMLEMMKFLQIQLNAKV